VVEARTTPEAGYDSVAKALHWLIVALLIAQFAVAWTMLDIGRGTQPETLINLHLSLGMTTLIVAVIRLLWRWRYPVPLIRGNVPLLLRSMARAAHAMFYLLLFALPILGWLAASARGWNIAYFGLFNFPRILSPSPALAGEIGDYHTDLSHLLLGLVGLHVLGAFYHHRWLRDRLLWRRLPGNQ